MASLRRDHYLTPSTGEDSVEALQAAIVSLGSARLLCAGFGDAAVELHLLASLIAESERRLSEGVHSPGAGSVLGRDRRSARHHPRRRLAALWPPLYCGSSLRRRQGEGALGQATNTAAGVSVFGRASACVTSWVGDPGANRIPAGVSVGSGRSAPGRRRVGSAPGRVGAGSGRSASGRVGQRRVGSAPGRVGQRRVGSVSAGSGRWSLHCRADDRRARHRLDTAVGLGGGLVELPAGE
jgi:hypothetical protein